jgi:hypothetical protein
MAMTRVGAFLERSADIPGGKAAVPAVGAALLRVPGGHD